MNISAHVQRASLASVGNNAMAVIANVVGINKGCKEEDVLVALSAATNHQFRAVPKSVINLADCGAGVHVVRALMTPTKDVLTADHASKMTALSSNMFMDASERLWHLKGNGKDSVLIGSQSEDPEVLLDMMTSCSNDVSGSNPALRRALDGHAAALAQVGGGDVVSYLSASGEMKTGFVVYTSKSADSTEDELGVMEFGSTDGEEIVNRQSISSIVPCASVEYPDVMLMSASGNASKAALLDYYRRVYGHAPDYFAKLQGIINGHCFA